MVPVGLARKGRTRLIRVAANGDDGFDRTFEELVEMLGMMVGEIDANLFHDLNRERVHLPGRFGSRAVDFQQIAGGGSQDSFGQMAAARIAGAENEDSRFHWVIVIRTLHGVLCHRVPKVTVGARL